MKGAIAIIVASVVASEAFVLPAAVSRASIAGASPSRHVVHCSASSLEPNTRLEFLKNSGLAVAAAAVGIAGLPTVATAVEAAEEEEVKVGVEVTNDSGLKYVVTKAGTGAKPNTGDYIKAHYTGWLNGFDEDGIKFDSSRDRGRPFSFRVGRGQVIKGWDEALGNMKIGERRQLIVPPELGYGSRGAGQIIPPNSTLYFEVELLAAQPV